MLTLHTPTGQLDLSPNAVDFTVENPIFDREGVDRTWSYPFYLPSTANNLVALGLPIYLSKAHRGQRVPCQVYLDGTPWLSGELRINATGPRRISVAFQSAGIRLAERLRSLRLRSLRTTSTITTPYRPVMVLSTVYIIPPATQFAIQINSDVFTAPLNDFAGLLEAINEKYPDTVEDGGAFFGFPLAPNEKWIYVRNQPDAAEYQIFLRPGVDNPSATAFFNLLQINIQQEANRIDAAWKTYLAARGDANFRFPVVKAPNLYDGKNSEYAGYANWLRSDVQEYFSDANAIDDPTAWIDTVLPLPRLTAVLRSIAESVGFGNFSGNFLAISEISGMLLWNNRPADKLLAEYGPNGYIQDALPNDGGGGLPPQAIRQYHVYDPQLVVGDYLPDRTALDLVLALINTFCLVVRPVGDQIQLQPIVALLRQAPADWTSLLAGPVEQSLPEFAGVTLDYDRQGDETDLPGQLQRVGGADDSTQYITPFYTLHELTEVDQRQVANDYVRSWRVPYTAEQGRSAAFGVTQEPSLRLLFYRGDQDDSNGDAYPLAGHSRQAYGGFAVGDYSLDWRDTTGGLYVRWWQEFIQLNQGGKLLRFSARLSAAQIQDLSRWRNPMIGLRTELGQVTAAVKWVRFKVGPTGVALAEVEAVTFGHPLNLSF